MAEMDDWFTKDRSILRRCSYRFISIREKKLLHGGPDGLQQVTVQVAQIL